MPLRRRALSLMELLVVLVILIATAGLVAYLYSSAMQITVGKDGSGNPITKSIQQIGTEATMAQIRNAIVGTPGHPGYWNDILSSQGDMTITSSGVVKFQGDMTITPITIADLFRVDLGTPVIPSSPSPYSAATALPTNLQAFNPNTGRGWRGPYILQATGTYPDVTTGNWSARNFTVGTYGGTGDPALIDAWGNPIVIQWPYSVSDGNPLYTIDGNPSPTEEQCLYVRLVSAGPNGKLETLQTDSNGQFAETPFNDPTGANTGDDVILYLRYVP